MCRKSNLARHWTNGAKRVRRDEVFGAGRAGSGAGCGQAVAAKPYVAAVCGELFVSVDRLGETRIYRPLPARSDCFLQLYLADQYEVVTVGSGALHRAPRFVLVGPHTYRREDLIWGGHLRCFTIRFTAVGFRSLFGVPSRLIANFAGAADAVLGSAVRELEQRLAEVAESALGPVADSFLMGLLARRGYVTEGRGGWRGCSGVIPDSWQGWDRRACGTV